MEDMILSVNTLPEPLLRRIRSKKVRVREENGLIILIPIQENHSDNKSALSRLRKKISDGRLTTEAYVAQKQVDKELEA